MRARTRCPSRRALLAGVGRIGVPKGRWRYQNPGGEIARAIGAERAVSLLASVGVLQQTLIGDACRAIAEGEIDTALVVGGDAGYRILRAQIEGVRAEERQQDDEPDVFAVAEGRASPSRRAARGMKMPVGLYAIMESAYRAQNGWSVDEHRDRLAQMYSRFSEIAADNPAAWNRKRVDAQTIRNASERNPMQAFPYTKLHCSTWNVDQAGALLFCSAERADELGIAHDKRIYPRASTESNHMAQVSTPRRTSPRARARASPAVPRSTQRSLSIADIDLVDLYTCFPVAVETYAAELGLPLDARPHGHGLDGVRRRAVQQLRHPGDVPHGRSSCARGRGRHGLVSSVSGVLTKQGFGLWSREPRNGFSLRDVSDDVARTIPAKRRARIRQRRSDNRGLHGRSTSAASHRAVSRSSMSSDARAVVQSEDPALVARMESDRAVRRFGAPRRRPHVHAVSQHCP